MKNEEVRAEDWCKAALPVSGSIVILDTGSTDKTKRILRRNKVMVFDSKIFSAFTPLGNFEFHTARNEAAEHVIDSDWILILDADEEVTIEDTSWLEQLAEVPEDIHGLQCTVRLRRKGGPAMQEFQSVRLHRNYEKIQWQGAMHNSLNIPPEKLQRFVGISVDSYRGISGEKNTEDRTKQRVAMAEKYFGGRIEDNPKDTRAMFYLAQTHFDVCDYAKAIRYFNLYLQTSTFCRDEAYQAALYLTKAYKAIGLLEDAEIVMSQSLRLNPTRAEGYLLLGRIAYEQGRYHDALVWYIWASKCDAVTVFFKEPHAYTYEPWEAMSMAYYRLLMGKKARECAEKALSYRKDMTASVIKQIEKNLTYFDKVAEEHNA